MNYYQEFLKISKSCGECEQKRKLLLHACCAPCSSASLEKVKDNFDITVYFYNPNITNAEEYQKRLAEEERFLSEVYGESVKLICGEYAPEVFYSLSAGLENQPERGARCLKCYAERLLKTAQTAKKNGFDYFATTLTLSPHKDANALNKIGYEIQEEIGVKYLPTDFKKDNGYKRSIELSKIYGLYRQNYCGCEFSVR